MKPNLNDPKQYLIDLFLCAVDAADPMKVVAKYLPERPSGRLFVIGAGKGSARMAQAVEAHYGPCEGFVITRYGYSCPTQGIQIVEASHPVPDEAGEAATQQLSTLVSNLSASDTVIALISGGGSALLCAPVQGISLQDKMDVNAELLASGAPISEMNIVRKRLSRVKGGKLAAMCSPARLLTLMISDVPGDDPSLIASGPTIADSGSAGDALAIIQKRNLILPNHVVSAIVKSADGPIALEDSDYHIVAAPSISLNAAAELATDCDVRILGDALEGEANDLAKQHALLAIELQSSMAPRDRPILLLSGGECTVTHRGQGVGGPNAEYVLSAANVLAGHKGIHVLSCDTDGVDGAAEVAGAYAGPNTIHKTKRLDLDIKYALQLHDSHTFFEKLGDQIITGPTLTNVNDFRALLIEHSE
ncbi:MAG: glycerate kinase [Paracoccaceae bacterium]|nr:glycerate kinase [Paracoccaceae bacterium]MDG2257426.1 glycerate kinase [Paracoccaceae bacterium]